MPCPLGQLQITGDEQGVSAIRCQDGVTELAAIDTVPEPLQLAVNQLTDYFNGTRQTFDFPVNPAGTSFQQRVWQALRAIPFSTTESYLTLSRRLGDEKAIRAVAAANGKNPLWIVVPCHRVIGTDGSLTGYAGGLWRKRWLLEHEGALPAQKQGQLQLF